MQMSLTRKSTRRGTASRGPALILILILGVALALHPHYVSAQSTTTAVQSSAQAPASTSAVVVIASPSPAQQATSARTSAAPAATSPAAVASTTAAVVVVTSASVAAAASSTTAARTSAAASVVAVATTTAASGASTGDVFIVPTKAIAGSTSGATASSSSSSSSSSSTTTGSATKSGLSVGAIAGVSIAGLIGLMMLTWGSKVVLGIHQRNSSKRKAIEIATTHNKGSSMARQRRGSNRSGGLSSFGRKKQQNQYDIPMPHVESSKGMPPQFPGAAYQMHAAPSGSQVSGYGPPYGDTKQQPYGYGSPHGAVQQFAYGSSIEMEGIPPPVYSSPPSSYAPTNYYELQQPHTSYDGGIQHPPPPQHQLQQQQQYYANSYSHYGGAGQHQQY